MASDQDKLRALSAKTYKIQAVTFLNAFWEEDPVHFGQNLHNVDKVWEVYQKVIKLDKKGAEGNELDEFNTHRLFEQCDGALTVQEMRKKLNEADIDFNRRVSLTEFLIYRFNVDWRVLVNAPQGGNNAKVAMAQEKVEAAQHALQVSIEAEEQAAKELELSIEAKKKAEDDEETSIQKAAEAKAGEEEVIEAQKESKAAVKAVEAQEKERTDMLADLEKKGNDDTLSTVKRNKARAELAQFKQEDPMPLRKARINQEAALRRVTKAVKEAKAQRIAADAAAEAAATARVDAGKAKVASEAAAENASKTKQTAEAALQEAQAFLEETKALYTGSWEGTMWWLDRELMEAKKFMPKSKVKRLESIRDEEVAKLVVGS